MSKEFTKDDVIQNKKEAIKSLNKLLESYINDPAGNHLKKANLLSYWIKDYVRMIDFEEKFDPSRNIAYKRGNIVKIDFGFNIGAEYGGLHYGVVLDNKNAHSSPVVTVIPLTSIKSTKKIHDNNVELGNELYRLLKLKYDTISKSLKEEQEEIKQELVLFKTLVHLTNDTIDELKTCETGTDNFKKKLDDAQKYLDASYKLEKAWKEKEKHNTEQQEYLDKIGNEISNMKAGSVALVNQITTISKIRIFDPRSLKGVLAGVSLSEENMEKINQKIKDLYVF
ncbi:type II toxin-antitoxin system PemK/MazF family toxin [Lachnospiraceae bacterium KGMB03038]|nr:type II toxin-antitoxin system PemK/MazF family toxin [Lachnospiraceae bacterium KGMB03038]